MELRGTLVRWWPIPAFAAYFGLLLVPKVYPAFGQTEFGFMLVISLVMVVIPALVATAAWSAIAFCVARLRGKQLGSSSAAMGRFAASGAIGGALFAFLLVVVPRPLPSGSYLSQFDRDAWLHPNAADDVVGDITPRQKMLADAVAKLPVLSRAQIENLLGPGLDTPYFLDAGRDLIYVLGPERDTPFAIDSEWLLIWLDDAGYFRRFEIWSD
jgi:hypothetical protein